MLTEKESLVYETIKLFIKNNNYSPTIRELCEILNYRSTNSIYRYLNQLKNKNYISYTKTKSRSIIITNIISNKFYVINTKETITLNINSEHLIYKIKNNYFKEEHIKKNDYLIINTKIKLKDNDLGLFIINNDYRVMRYAYKDGYYILKDNEEEVLYKVKIVGKVEGIYRIKI